jgi:pimeloyl-ACP methyl ester carboxylesterase
MPDQEVTISSGDVRLAGTLCLPADEGRFPCVLMIHGSGPLDRNENARGLPLNIFNTIAQYLADIGFASLRYDKRGCGKSGGNYWDAGFYDLIQDAKMVYDYLLKRECIESDRIFLLGHSEGGYIAPKISLTYTSIAGLVLIAPSVQKMEKVLEEQVHQLQRDLEDAKGIKRNMIKLGFKLVGKPEKTQETALRKVRETERAWFRYKGQRINAKWLREILDYDPVYTMQNVTCAVLAVSGEKDIQVDPRDTIRIAELAKGEVEHHIIPDMTHLLRLERSEPSLLNYKKLVKQDVDRSLLELMGDWLRKRV